MGILDQVKANVSTIVRMKDGGVVIRCRRHRTYKARKPPRDAECAGCKLLWARRQNTRLKVVGI